MLTVENINVNTDNDDGNENTRNETSTTSQSFKRFISVENLLCCYSLWNSL